MADYPEDHQVGIEVPRGGSDCQKCEYLKDPEKRICGNKFFIRAACTDPVKPAGSSKIPLPIDEYCCDLFQTRDNDGDEPKNPLVHLRPRVGY